ncbi:DNA mismatch repair protein mutL [Paenibacillus alvei TS-15]|uniref:DNA mismatch repair protein MutL n=1 Tax=Paenibacillus alvei TS-15 TaxID=1117108 RepID=S9SL10_PAEAL|nr:DNA mismatch repair endonuclease MutL [Paenibacillus alvei]EPY05379.1 DNA mismatch repair protein mutL [Paenibacillus alvei TS-15]
MAIIKILDEHIANQIAAGEVVERPSSVVKELVENSIDAGATRIDVSVEEGGLQLIRVKDNGSGIADDDAENAFLRHATSKIQTGKDLFSIRSLGFRGEALPSIAAVAKVELVTSTESSGLGRRLVIEGGTIKSYEPAQSMQGTEITVRELFYNTPARLKYMKTIQTELGHISDLIYRLALSYPSIAFTLKHNEHTLLQTIGNGDLLQVIASVYGVQTAKGMLQVKGEHLDFEVEGYIGKPELTRSNRNAMSWMINGRYVRSFPLNQAILRAYHTFLPINRYPMLVLHVTMHPSLVDVNVHPAKLEVRFSKEAELCAFIEETVKQLLHKQRLIPEAAPKKAKVRTYVEQAELQWEAAETIAANQEKQFKPMGALVIESDPSSAAQLAKEDREQSQSNADTFHQPNVQRQPELTAKWNQTAATEMSHVAPEALQPTNESVIDSTAQRGSVEQQKTERQQLQEEGRKNEDVSAGAASEAPVAIKPTVSSSSNEDAVNNPAKLKQTVDHDLIPSTTYDAETASIVSGQEARERVRETSPSYGSRNAGSSNTSAYSNPYSNAKQQPGQSAVKAGAEKWKEWLTEEGSTDNAALPKFPALSYIGQLHGTYLIASNEEGLYLIDQHAAHERINYEYYFERFGKPVEASQELLLPITLEFTPADAERIRSRMHLLEQVGIVMEPFGGQTFLVRSHPYWFPKGEETDIIQEMTDWVLSEKAPDIAKLREASATMCSCKASIKANQRLTAAEAETLFVRLGTCRQPFTCPHGRPIIIRFTTYDLEKMFKRVM